MKVIEATPDAFGGVCLTPDSLTDDPEQFRNQLRQSLSVWKGEGIKVVWLEIPISKAGLVPVAVEAGFSFHHAEEAHLSLTRRLVEGAHVPPYASHFIGVGA